MDGGSSGANASSISAGVARRRSSPAVKVLIQPHSLQIVLSPGAGRVSFCTPDAQRSTRVHCGHWWWGMLQAWSSGTGAIIR